MQVKLPPILPIICLSHTTEDASHCRSLWWICGLVHSRFCPSSILSNVHLEVCQLGIWCVWDLSQFGILFFFGMMFSVLDFARSGFVQFGILFFAGSFFFDFLWVQDFIKFGSLFIRRNIANFEILSIREFLSFRKLSTGFCLFEILSIQNFVHFAILLFGISSENGFAVQFCT